MSEDILAVMADEIGLPGDALARVEFTGQGAMASCFRTTDFAAASIAAAGLGINSVLGIRGSSGAPGVGVDQRLSSFWFHLSLRPQGWEIPAVWDLVAGDYEAEDGWIRLHTNAPHHRAEVLKVLGVGAERLEVAAAVSTWSNEALETAIVEAGGCAAAMRSIEDWKKHPQGQAVRSEKLAQFEFYTASGEANWRLQPERPLAGVRVLDLTRILAGPVATRFLAGYGADVLRIDPIGWEEPAAAPEVTLGKKCARLDMKSNEGKDKFKHLLASADVLVHGYRSDALHRLGLGAAERRSINPGLIDVSLDAYGFTGPWRTRRGFDSLVQMSSGIAEAGMRAAGAHKPVPLPVQALDHGTGYMMAAAVLRGIYERATTGRALAARFSLARTAKFLAGFPAANGFDAKLEAENPDDLSPVVEETVWGEAKRLKAPLEIAGTPMHWSIPAGKLGRHAPAWAG